MPHWKACPTHRHDRPRDRAPRAPGLRPAADPRDRRRCLHRARLRRDLRRFAGHATGLSKSALYHHFESKEHLLSVALDEALGGLEGVLARAGRPRGRCGGAPRLRAARRGPRARRQAALRHAAAPRSGQQRRRAAGARASALVRPRDHRNGPRGPAGGHRARGRRRRRSPPGCCSAWSTRSSSGTARPGRRVLPSSRTTC